jgi:peptide/nickel transport system permease protein
LANAAVRRGSVLLCLMVLIAVAAPWLYTIDPNAMDPASSNTCRRARAASSTRWPATPSSASSHGHRQHGPRHLEPHGLRRARVAHGGRGGGAGARWRSGCWWACWAGYFRRIDGTIMRVMDGVMAIPGILFAIVLVAVLAAQLLTVMVAIAVPETPRVARLVRSVVLSVREEPYVEAAIALDTPTWKLMLRHILPNTVAPLIVQGTFVCAAAMLVEAVMSFLGIGLPSDVPTWGNIMSEGRA